MDVIIVVEAGEAEAVVEEEAPAAAEEVALEPATEEPVEVAGDDLGELLSAGDRSLVILFGSQSGNSEALAAKFTKQASNYGLDGVVYDLSLIHI